MSVTLRGLSKNQYADALNALSLTEFANLASVGAGVAQTAIQARKTLPFTFKVRKVSVNLTALDSVGGANAFNVVVGSGTYETAGTAAHQTATLAGTPTATSAQTVTTTINGTAVVYTETTGDTTVTILAGHVVSAINANATVSKLVTASNVAGVITITANAPGTAGNAITLTTATNDSGITYTRGAATLAGGVNASGITLAANDNSDTYGYPTNVAVANNALFGADVPFNSANTIAANAYAYPGNDGPNASLIGQGVPNTGWNSLATATGGYGIFVPTNYDAVYPAGLPLTLRCVTGATVGSLTNLQVSLAIVPVGLRAMPGDAAGQTLILPATDF
jgi:hypothetical protein